MTKLKYISGGVTAAKGFMAAGIHAGIRKNSIKNDLALVYTAQPAKIGGVFTQNLYAAAPVNYCRQVVERGTASALVANSGNANAVTGDQGVEDTLSMAAAVAAELNIAADQVLVCSTGVIGVNLPMEVIKAGIKAIAPVLSPDGGNDAAQAIMTTDTVSKEVAVEITLSDGRVATIGGMAKGSGMIHPNMATLLCFITTDMPINSAVLQTAVKYAADRSFNMLTVDGDTSTNDSMLVMANGIIGGKMIEENTADFELFTEALTAISIDLTKMMAADGEGANHLLEIEVVNAFSREDAARAAKAVAASNLVKSAFFGEDANWGRIICAVGYAGITLPENKTDMTISSDGGSITVMQDGVGLVFDEILAKKILSAKDIKVYINLKCGAFSATAWGCDLSYEYVRINGDYRT